ncbi:MAG: hypothetical protein AB7N91_20360 [Candidatus Tectimicrobiota bacterium]
MELHHRVELVDSLLEEAEQKQVTLSHALQAKERAEQNQGSTHGAPVTDEEEELKYEQGLWQQAEGKLTDLRSTLEELERLERQRGVSE